MGSCGKKEWVACGKREWLACGKREWLAVAVEAHVLFYNQN